MAQSRRASCSESPIVENSSTDLRDLFQSVSDHLTSLGEDVQVKELKNYIAFKHVKSFAPLEVYAQAKVRSAKHWPLRHRRS